MNLYRTKVNKPLFRCVENSNSESPQFSLSYLKVQNFFNRKITFRKFLIAFSILLFGISTNAHAEIIESNPSTQNAEQNISETIFSDVSETHPSYEAIYYLKKHGIIKGYDDGSFRPEKSINRAEALKIILMGANYHFTDDIHFSATTNNAEKKYSDLEKNAWYIPYILKATELKIVSGYSDGTFKPEKGINKAEGLKMILKSNDVSLEENIKESLYIDVPSESWFAIYFQYYKNYHLLEIDENGSVDPAQKLNRGELADLMYRFIKREEFAKKPEKISQTITKEFITGKATFYGRDDGFNGRRTASGEIFDDTLMTAAHRDLPFGTLIRVYSKEDITKYVDVTINDRGPYDYRFILDLSASAFEKLAPISRGFIEIQYEIIKNPYE